MRRCPDARGGLLFYRVRFSSHRRARGLETAWPAGRKPHNCADARYLAGVWHSRAFIERKLTERWQRSIGQVIARLNRGIAGTPMAGSGQSLERWGRRFHVSPYFMVAAAATESSIGAAACDTYNAWGLGNCGSAWSVPRFSSWDEAIAYYARYIARGWPNHSTPYSFSGYAECDSCWGNTVSRWMYSLFGVPAVTRYP